MKLFRPVLPNEIQITGSKSESNRLLILQKLFGNIEIKNISNSQDTNLLQKALNSDEKTIDIHHAGTAMRFLTSFFAVQEGVEKILTGSERMKQRPIKPLLEALRELGADIEYLENEGFPPLKIKGKKLEKNFVEIPADISSQFITSLILVGGKLENGLTIKLLGEITSKPYIEMTLKLLSEISGKSIILKDKTIQIPNIKTQKTVFTVESDWSSASYFYSFSALDRQKITLKNFNKNSLQGDSRITEIYSQFFGIDTIFNENQQEITLIPKNNFSLPQFIQLNMNDCPDIAQTICVTAAALKIPFEIGGLATLKIKETDRLSALQNELKKIGCETEITDNSIKSVLYTKPEKNISIATYGDHRMAMAFAPYSLIQEIEIQNPEVVEKSFPDFWEFIK
jgi:3-phosphoshikimate 1-carboxyvinyltransferase